MTSAPDLPDGATWTAWGIDPTWSRTLDVPSHDHGTHTWHLLDTGPPSSGDTPTIVCVHGNPTWAYAWKTFLNRFGDTHRVVAVDQLGMGYSDRTGRRRYADRVSDLADVIETLDLGDAPIVLAAHDWGGAIAMGWAVEHPERVAGMVLCNTGIAVPEGRGAPKIIRLAGSAPLRDLVCRRTNGFVEGTVRLSGSRITKTDRIAFRAPYRSARHRAAVSDFVGDVPLSSPHESEAALQAVSDRLPTIDAPVLLAWGSRDIVFDDDFAADLAGKLPNTVIHRFAEANHLVMAEADVAGVVDDWLHDLAGDGAQPRPQHPAPTDSVFSGIERRRDDRSVAIADLASRTTLDFASLARRVDGVAAELARRGLRPGDRVAMLTPPGIDLLVAVYGVWRAGGVTVIADRGLGLGGLGAAVSSARPSWTIGPRAARVAAATFRWAPRSEHVDVVELMGVADESITTDLAPAPAADDLAAILFTSGATGPAKGVRYTHAQLAAQRDALARTYSIGDHDRLVAAFAPFAIYGPSLGVPTAFTDCDVTTPGDLTAAALDEACEEIGATMAFASPAALTNVAATAHGTSTDGIAALRLVFSAGAPVPAEILRSIRELAPNSSIHTPYGMTEALPVADIDLVGIVEAETVESPRGVCVGVPVDGAEVRIAGLGFDALDGVPDAVDGGITGEILVRAPWVSEGYLGRWKIQRAARPGEGWHRSGDVGHVDASGRLWVEGRAVHVIDSVGQPTTPVPIERAVERSLAPLGLAVAGRVAAVGVGPSGCQHVVVVVERAGVRPGLADEDITEAVRSAVDVDVAAVLVHDRLPVDIRHNAKIDRAEVAGWASALLAGDQTSAGPIERLRRLVGR